MPQFADARAIAPENLGGVIQLARSIQQFVGVTPRLITRPADTRILTIRCESGTIRLRPGDYRGIDFNDSVVNGGTDALGLTAHGFLTGQGPFQFTLQDAALAANTSVVINETLDRFERAAGSWLIDGFQIGDTVTLTESASNDGAFTVVAPIGALNLTVSEDIIVGEVAQTDLVMTAPQIVALGLDLLTDRWVINDGVNSIKIASSLANALAGTQVDLAGNGSGRSNFGGSAGWGANAVAAASKSDGYGSVAIVAGETLSFVAPAELTIVGLGATDACAYWFGR